MHKVYMQWRGKWLKSNHGNCRLRLINKLYKKTKTPWYREYRKFRMWDDI